MPRPPIHCVKARQKSRHLGRVSISLMQVAPVVVKPLMVSKKALERFMSVRHRYGTMPTTENTIHESATMRKLSARRIRLFSHRRLRNTQSAPTPIVPRAVSRKASQPRSP